MLFLSKVTDYLRINKRNASFPFAWRSRLVAQEAEEVVPYVGA